MIYPDFSENTEKGVTLYFALENRSPEALLAELSKVYYCYSAAGTVEKDGKKFIALTVEDEA